MHVLVKAHVASKLPQEFHDSKASQNSPFLLIWWDRGIDYRCPTASPEHLDRMVCIPISISPTYGRTKSSGDVGTFSPRSWRTFRIVSSMRLFGQEAPAVIPMVASPVGSHDVVNVSVFS